MCILQSQMPSIYSFYHMRAEWCWCPTTRGCWGVYVRSCGSAGGTGEYITEDQLCHSTVVQVTVERGGVEEYRRQVEGQVRM